MPVALTGEKAEEVVGLLVDGLLDEFAVGTPLSNPDISAILKKCNAALPQRKAQPPPPRPAGIDTGFDSILSYVDRLILFAKGSCCPIQTGRTCSPASQPTSTRTSGPPQWKSSPTCGRSRRTLRSRKSRRTCTIKRAFSLCLQSCSRSSSRSYRPSTARRSRRRWVRE